MANVQAQGLPRSPADESTAQLSHVVDLQSLDEGRLDVLPITELPHPRSLKFPTR